MVSATNRFFLANIAGPFFSISSDVGIDLAITFQCKETIPITPLTTLTLDLTLGLPLPSPLEQGRLILVLKSFAIIVCVYILCTVYTTVSFQ